MFTNTGLRKQCEKVFLTYFRRRKSTNNNNNRSVSSRSTTHFGFETVTEAEKTEKVRQVFDAVAGRYDFMNDTFSCGYHRIWKDVFVERLSPTDGTNLLEMASGTGDIALRYVKYCHVDNLTNCHVTMSDINAEMLEVGQRCLTAYLTSTTTSPNPVDVTFRQCNAENLPFEDDTYTAYTIAFGIRNVTRVEDALKEAYRVLKPGGRFLCLEFSHVTNEFAQWCYDQYSFQLIPVLGELLTGEWRAYQYLVESIRRFPDQETFKLMLEEAGFRHVTYENLTMGVVAIHSAFKI